MSLSLFELLENFAWGVHCLALGIGAAACLRLWKRGGDKAFAAAAWMAFPGIALLSLPWLLGWSMAFLPLPTLWWEWAFSDSAANAGSILLFGHFLLFAAGAFRMAGRLPARIPDGGARS